ncbi:MAG TPA: hypothetical protein VGF22_13710, partial [Acidimicrobiales bacterium]
MSLRPRVVAAACALALVSIAAGVPASADPVGDKQRQVNQITDEIERLGDVAANLGEAYNGAVVQLQQAQADVAAAQTKLDDLERRLQTVRSAAAAFAVRAYMYADQTSGVASLLAGTSVSSGSAQREGYNAVALGNSADITDDMKALIQDADTQKAVLEAAQARQTRFADNTKARQEAAEAAQAAQQHALVKVKGELATLVVQEQQRRAAAAAAQAAAEKQRAEAALVAAAQQQAQLAAAARSTAAAVPAARPQSPVSTASPTTRATDNGDTGRAGGEGDSPGTTQAPAKRADPPAVDVPATSPG